jgi:hypothetical protein
MPHALTVPSAPPDRAGPDRRPAPAIRASRVCPNCGRSPAVVFPDLRTGKATDEAPLVCLECCPKEPGDDPGPAH